MNDSPSVWAPRLELHLMFLSRRRRRAARLVPRLRNTEPQAVQSDCDSE